MPGDGGRPEEPRARHRHCCSLPELWPPWASPWAVHRPHPQATATPCPLAPSTNSHPEKEEEISLEIHVKIDVFLDKQRARKTAEPESAPLTEDLCTKFLFKIYFSRDLFLQGSAELGEVRGTERLGSTAPPFPE